MRGQYFILLRERAFPWEMDKHQSNINDQLLYWVHFHFLSFFFRINHPNSGMSSVGDTRTHHCVTSFFQTKLFTAMHTHFNTPHILDSFFYFDKTHNGQF